MDSVHVDALRIIDIVHAHFPTAQMETHNGTGYFEVGNVPDDIAEQLRLLGAEVVNYYIGRKNNGYHGGMSSAVISFQEQHDD